MTQIEEFHQFSDTEVARTLYPWGLVETVEPSPFELESCIERYAAGLPLRTSTDAHPWRDDFARKLSGKRGVWTDEEVRFWFVALTNPRRLDADRNNQLTVEALGEIDVTAPLDVGARFTAWVQAFTSRYRNVRFYSQAYLARLMLQLVGLEQTLQILLADLDTTWMSAFFDELYPTPAVDDRQALANLGTHWLNNATVGFGGHRDMALLGLENAQLRLLSLTRPPQDVRQFLQAARKTPPRSEAALYHVLNAEPDDQAFLDYLESYRPDLGRREVVLLLGRLGFEACDWITARVRASRRAPEEGLVGALAKVRSPRVVGALLHLAEQTTTGKEAREALSNLDLAYASGLVAAATGRTKSRDLAASLLLALETSNPQLYMAALDAQPDDVKESVAERVSSSVVERRPELPEADWPLWMTDLAAETRPKGMPRFCAAKHLLPFYLADAEHEVPASVVMGVLVALRDHDWSLDGRVFGANIRIDLDTESAANAIWAIFEAWTRNGFPTAHRWCMYAVSEFASEAQILEFAARIGEWPSIGERERAYEALGVLELHGSDTALASLNRIAKSSKFKGMRSRAQNFLTRLATRQGVTPAQLEDLIIDDCGLEDDGTALFDYGAREFRLAFDAELNPVVRDEDGKKTKSLPRPRKSDHHDLVASERERFKTMKKRLGQVLGLQAQRLETALGEQRRWGAKPFRQQYVHHPVMTHLVQRFLWAEYDGPVATRFFRVTAERGLADDKDEELELATNSRVGLVHPLELTVTQLETWGAIFADYEILPPFPQLDREVRRTESRGQYQVGLDDVELAPGWLRGHFNRRGWSKSAPEGEAMLTVYRDFHAAETRVYARLDPGLSLDYRRERDQRITEVWFVNRQGWRESGALQLNQVSPVVFSESMYDLHLLIDRARAGANH